MKPLTIEFIWPLCLSRSFNVAHKISCILLFQGTLLLMLVMAADITGLIFRIQAQNSVSMVMCIQVIRPQTQNLSLPILNFVMNEFATSTAHDCTIAIFKSCFDTVVGKMNCWSDLRGVKNRIFKQSIIKFGQSSGNCAASHMCNMLWECFISFAWQILN